VDAARLLAGFDEVDRLVKLEGAAMELEPGTADLREAIRDTLQRLQAVLRGRSAGFVLKSRGEDFLVPLDRGEAMVLCWRLLATAAAALAPGDHARLVLVNTGEHIRLKIKAPRPLFAAKPPEAGENARQGAVNTGMFGPAFAFRLAQAEARAAGGELICKRNRVTLVVPALTASRGEPSAGAGRMGG
jgi:pimeloyl-ACP methyl ester carboxylesterase